MNTCTCYECKIRKRDPDSAAHNKPHFIAWYGGECPVRNECIVEVLLTGGYVWLRLPADFFQWDHDSLGRGIIAHRVIEEQ